MKHTILTALAVVAFGVDGAAQMPRTPGPEHARLEAFTGRWSITGEAEDGTYSGTETCEWFAGRFHVVCRRGIKGLLPNSGHSMLSYDPVEKAYTLHTINSLGVQVILKGAPAAGVWRWSGDLNVGERPIKVRLTMTPQSPSAMTYLMEGTLDGTSWMSFESGRSARLP